MDLACERPLALLGLLLLVPCAALLALKWGRIAGRTALRNAGGIPEAARLRNLPKVLFLRGIFWAFAWAALVLSYAGISFGVRLVPVQKVGTAVSFVFDISYSMNAADEAGGMSRLSAAGRYASLLLSRMPSSLVSVTLSKGEGVVVVPLTEDRAVVQGLLESLSPGMMSSSGSSIGNGIMTALKSFPEQSPMANAIWVFTDGDETDSEVRPALEECVRRGVSVCLIGFGSLQGAQVVAGDGKTMVHTALRAEKMAFAAKSVMEGVAAHGGSSAVVRYVVAGEQGSALSVLEAAFPQGADGMGGMGSFDAYEREGVPRHSLFLWLSVLFFACGVVVSEVDAQAVRKKLFGGASVLPLFAMTFAFSSCGARFEGAKAILLSSWECRRRNYDSAVAGFLQASYIASEDGDEALLSYALYGLASAYLMEGEGEAAKLRFEQIPEDAPQKVRAAAFYNMGVIAARAGDSERAVWCFKKSLEADASQIDAKINLEIANANVLEERRSRESASAQVSSADAPSALEQAVFERIREDGQRQWKNSGKSESSGSADDY